MQQSNQDTIIQAVQAYHAGQFKSIRAAAKAFSIPKTTLTERLAGIPSRADIPAHNRALTLIEEEVLLQKILNLDARGYSPTQDVIRAWASSITTARSQKEVGVRWAHNFVKRHPELETRFSRRLSAQRAKNEDPQVIQDWFRLVQNIISFHGIHKDDIYNFDESGFRIGYCQNTMVVTSTERKQRPKALVSDSTQWTTVIAAINSQGWSVPPYILFSGKEMNRAWFKHLPPQWKLGVSPKGWTSNAHGVAWIQHFDQHTKNKRSGVKRLLILDGHESHMTPEFESFCQDHDIITLCMPPHSSHLLQPLDVGCFGPLKKAYSKRIRRLGRVGYHYLIKEDFLPEFRPAYEAAFTPQTIQGAFKGSGLYPLDPQAVLSKLTLVQRTPSPPVLSTQLWISQTPQNPTQVGAQTTLIRDKVIQHQDSSPTPILEAIDRLAKGFQKSQATMTILQSEHDNMKRIVEELQSHRAPRKKIRLTLGIDTEELAYRDNAAATARQVIGLVNGIEKQPRAKPTCSKCGIQGHNSRGCH